MGWFCIQIGEKTCWFLLYWVASIGASLYSTVTESCWNHGDMFKLPLRENWHVTTIAIVISCKYFGISLKDAETLNPLTVSPFALLLVQHSLLSPCLQISAEQSRPFNLQVIGVSSSPRSSSSSLHFCPCPSTLVSLGLPLLFIPIARRQTADKGFTVSQGFLRIEMCWKWKRHDWQGTACAWRRGKKPRCIDKTHKHLRSVNNEIWPWIIRKMRGFFLVTDIPVSRQLCQDANDETVCLFWTAWCQSCNVMVIKVMGCMTVTGSFLKSKIPFFVI